MHQGKTLLGNYHYLFDNGLHLRVPVATIDRFCDSCLEEMPSIRPFLSRIGRCFWLDFFVLTQRYQIPRQNVLKPLLDLEFGEPPNGMKPATPFKHFPLKGLWHKHWFSPRFLPANLIAVAQRKGSMDWIWNVAKEGNYMTEQLIGQIAHHMTVGAFEDRHAAKQITGEWIIFLPHAGFNYYLCLGTHETGDERIHEKIQHLCALDFPDIAQWIDEAALDF